MELGRANRRPVPAVECGEAETTTTRSWSRHPARSTARRLGASLLLPLLLLFGWTPQATGGRGGMPGASLLAGAAGLRLLLMSGSVARAQLPRAPATLAVQYVRETSVALQWEAVEGAEAYRVWSRYEEDGATFQVAKDIYAPPFASATNTTVLTGLIYGRPLYLKIAAGTSEGAFETENSPTVRTTPIAPPEQAVQSFELIAYGPTAVTLSWGLAGADTGAGPPATVFAVLYKCSVTNTVEKRYPVDFTAQAGTIVPDMDIEIGLDICTRSCPSFQTPTQTQTQPSPSPARPVRAAERRPACRQATSPSSPATSTSRSATRGAPMHSQPGATRPPTRSLSRSRLHPALLRTSRCGQPHSPCGPCSAEPRRSSPSARSRGADHAPPQVTAASLSSLTIAWAPADDALRFRVSYVPVVDGAAVGDPVVFVEGTASTSVEVTGLALGTSYTMTVHSRNKHVAGYDAAPGVALTSAVEGAPPAPVLTVGDVSFDRVEVAWAMPVASIQPLVFNVRYSQVLVPSGCLFA